MASVLPGAPNKYTAALCEGMCAGHALVAFGAGHRLVIAHRDDAELSVIQVTSELPGEVTAVAWSSDCTGFSASCVHSILAAATRHCVVLYVPIQVRMVTDLRLRTHERIHTNQRSKLGVIGVIHH